MHERREKIKGAMEDQKEKKKKGKNWKSCNKSKTFYSYWWLENVCYEKQLKKEAPGEKQKQISLMDL